MELLDPTQMFSPIPNTPTETNATQLPLMGMMKTCMLIKKQKKSCSAVRVYAAAKEKTELRMFYLKNASMNPLDVFPKDMPNKICANFTCKGKECSNINCNFIHPKRPSELKQETIFGNRQSFQQKRHWLVQQVSFHEDVKNY
jgi:hypothetical protein